MRSHDRRAQAWLGLGLLCSAIACSSGTAPVPLQLPAAGASGVPAATVPSAAPPVRPATLAPPMQAPANPPPMASSMPPSGDGAMQPAPTAPSPSAAAGSPAAMPVAGGGAQAAAGAMPAGAGGAAAPASDPGFPDKDFHQPVMPCEMGKLQGSEIIIMGESFYALSNEIQRDLEGNAKMAGSPQPYRGFAVSGTTLGNNQIPSQFDRALMGGPVKLVIMDGGGNDQYNRYCEECPGIVEKLFAHMAESGVKDVLYTFYPDPGNPIGSAPFKKYHDMLRLTIREVCVKETALRCHFLDLRPFWKPGDTNDGLHPTSSGARHVADAIWDFMKADCLGQ